MVAWEGVDRYGDLPVTRAAFRRSDGTWEEQQNLGYSSDDVPAVAIDGRGDAVSSGRKSAQLYDGYAEFRPAGGRWEPAVVLSQQGFVSYARVVMNRRGDAFALWESDVAGSRETLSSLRPAGSSTWTAASGIPVARFSRGLLGCA